MGISMYMHLYYIQINSHYVEVEGLYRAVRIHDEYFELE